MDDNWNKHDFTIGEIAHMLDIPAKMLRYWDQIGLLKPHSVDLVNGYRYYSSSQFYLLNFIKFLKKLNVPYEIIKSRLHETDIQCLVDMLKEQIAATDEKIRELISIKDTSLNLVADMEEALKTTDLETVKLETLPERTIILLDWNIRSRTDFEICIGRLEKLIFGSPTLLVSGVGLMLDKDRLMNGQYDSYCGAYVPFGRFVARENHLRSLPAGEYAVLRYWGNILSSAPFYERLADFIRDKGYTACGNMIRRCLAPGTIKETHAHLSEISIEVKHGA